MNYVAGWNMQGYSPDPDNLWITDSFESAVGYLRDTVEAWSEWDFDLAASICGCDDPSHESDDDTVHPRDIGARYATAYADLSNPGTGPEFWTVVYDRNGYPYSFWINETDEPMEDE